MFLARKAAGIYCGWHLFGGRLFWFNCRGAVLSRFLSSLPARRFVLVEEAKTGGHQLRLLYPLSNVYNLRLGSPPLRVPLRQIMESRRWFVVSSGQSRPPLIRPPDSGDDFQRGVSRQCSVSSTACARQGNERDWDLHELCEGLGWPLTVGQKLLLFGFNLLSSHRVLKPSPLIKCSTLESYDRGDPCIGH